MSAYHCAIVWITEVFLSVSFCHDYDFGEHILKEHMLVFDCPQIS